MRKGNALSCKMGFDVALLSQHSLHSVVCIFAERDVMLWIKSLCEAKQGMPVSCATCHRETSTSTVTTDGSIATDVCMHSASSWVEARFHVCLFTNVSLCTWTLLWTILLSSQESGLGFMLANAQMYDMAGISNYSLLVSSNGLLPPSSLGSAT